MCFSSSKSADPPPRVQAPPDVSAIPLIGKPAVARRRKGKGGKGYGASALTMDLNVPKKTGVQV